MGAVQVVHMQALSHKDGDDADDEDESFNYNHLCSSPSNGMAGEVAGWLACS